MVEEHSPEAQTFPLLRTLLPRTVHAILSDAHRCLSLSSQKAESEWESGRDRGGGRLPVPAAGDVDDVDIDDIDHAAAATLGLGPGAGARRADLRCTGRGTAARRGLKEKTRWMHMSGRWPRRWRSLETSFRTRPESSKGLLRRPRSRFTRTKTCQRVPTSGPHVSTQYPRLDAMRPLMSKE